MGPKKKKQPKNAFYFFMCDWKEQKEDQGMRFPGGLREVSVACQEDWEYLPANLMDKFKRMEKEAKEKDKDDSSNKFTSTGKSYKEMENEKREAEEFERRMNTEIYTIMEECGRNRNLLQSRCFYLIHSNVYIYWGEKKQWVPCEVAISEFNLIDGLKRTYHVFPGVITKDNRLPMGYKLESKQRRDSVHHIPDPEDFDRIETNYDKICEDLLKFLKPKGGKEIPPLFTMEDDFNTNSNMSAVKDFLENVADVQVIDFRVYNLPLFFFHLRNMCVNETCDKDKEKGFPTLGLALQQLERDYYNFCEDLACDFHVNTEGFSNCSLSIVKRWVFLICEFCCPDLNLPLVPGRHCVKTANIDTSRLKAPSSYAPVQKVNSYPSAQKESSYTPAPRNSYKPAPNESSFTPTPRDSYKPAEKDKGGPVPTPAVRSLVGSAPTQMAWGRGILSMSSDMQRVSLEDKRPGQMTASTPPQVLGQSPSHAAGAGVTMIDYTKVIDPSSVRTYKVGQSPNVVSEVLPDESPQGNLRLPSSRGRGESLALALGKKDNPAPTFSQEDFPAIGASSGRPQRPIGSVWGRGFSTGPKPS